MNEQDVDRIASMIYEAPIGEYIGRAGAEVFARRAASELELADGEYLYHRGDSADAFYILTAGRLGMVRDRSRVGKEFVVHVLEKGDLVGELSFFDQTPHTLSVRALGESAVLRFDASDIAPLITEQPKLIYDFMRAVIKRVHHVVATLSEHELELRQLIASAGRQR